MTQGLVDTGVLHYDPETGSSEDGKSNDTVKRDTLPIRPTGESHFVQELQMCSELLREIANLKTFTPLNNQTTTSPTARLATTYPAGEPRN